MFLWFISILTLAAAAADIIHYRRLRRRGTSARNLRLFVALAAATDALPPVIALTDALSRDNTTGFMLFAMWAFWVWMITVLPRIACYFFRLVGLPRAGIAAGICVAALLIWGTTRGRTQIRVSRTEVCSERIPAGFDGFRIVQFSDVHLGTLVCPEAELSRIADSINSLHPDLVVFCGDLVNIRGSELDARAMRLLGGTQGQILGQVIWPACLPWLLTSLRTGLGLSLSGAIVGEYLGSTRGMGWLLSAAGDVFNAQRVLCCVLILVILIILLDGVVRLLEARLLRWR